MAAYGTFKYGSGVTYGGRLGQAQLFKINAGDPSNRTQARYVKLTIKYLTQSKWSVDTIRLSYARRAHVLPGYRATVNQCLKRTKVTLKYSTDEFWGIDSIRLQQRIKKRGPTV